MSDTNWEIPVDVTALDVGVDVNVELVDNAVIFFKSGPMEWNDSASWYLIDQLRPLVVIGGA